MSDVQKQKALHEQHVRLLYSLGDFQLALSALTFLAECDFDESYSNVELRKFRCFETTAIISYTRPFAQSRGGPRLTIEMTGAELTVGQYELHDKLLLLRNKVIAHSDADMMRMASKSFRIPSREEDIVLFKSVFDEGLYLSGSFFYDFLELREIVSHAIYKKLFDLAQRNPDIFNLKLNADGRVAPFDNND